MAKYFIKYRDFDECIEDWTVMEYDFDEFNRWDFMQVLKDHIDYYYKTVDVLNLRRL